MNKTVPVNCQTDLMFRDALSAVLVNTAREIMYTKDNVPSTGKGIYEMYRSGTALRVFFEVYHDTVGQALYYKKHNDFCVDQRSNTVNELDKCLGIKFLKRGDVRSASAVMVGYMTECGL